jgi:hypothetical protein
MQNDSAAFEGWLLVLKYWLSEEIEYVVLDFDAREDMLQKYGSPEACHYNRFLYRLHNMARYFPSWFFVNEKKTIRVLNFKYFIHSEYLQYASKILFTNYKEMAMVDFGLIGRINFHKVNLCKIVLKHWNEIELQLPKTFDSYFLSLGAKTRHHLRQDIKRINKLQNVKFVTPK